MTRLAWLLICLILLLPLPLRAAAASGPLEISLFGIFAPEELSFSASGGSTMRLRLGAVDGRTRRLRGKRVSVRCRAGQPLALRLDGRPLTASRLQVRPGAEGRPIRAGVPGRQAERPYAGWLEVDERQGRCRLIDHLDLEDYVRSVACGEIRGAGPAALQAQAVVARTWALKNRGRHAEQGFDFCDLTHCQAYQGLDACSPAQSKSFPPAQGMVLRGEDGRLLDATYFSTCGGHTAAASDIWGRRPGAAATVGVSDGQPAACRRSPHFRWRFRLDRAVLCRELASALGGRAAAREKADCQLEILSRGRGGWIREIAVRGPQTFALSGERFRLTMGRLFGWSGLKSANFVIQRDGDALVFIGRGLGHGVGMCQHGAMALSESGWSFERILKRYFPKARLERLP